MSQNSMFSDLKKNWSYIDSPWDLLVPCEEAATKQGPDALCITSHILGILSGYLFPIIGSTGVVLNFLIFYTFLVQYPPKQRTRQIIYLSALALADNFSIIAFGWLWIFPAKGLPYMTQGKQYFFTFNESEWVCKLHRYVYSFASTLAVNLFLLTSIDRFLSIYFPLRYSKLGKSVAWLLVSITTLVSGLIMIPFGTSLGWALTTQNQIICWLLNADTAFVLQLYHVLFSNCGFIQTVAIISVNLGLLFKLKNAQELRKSLQNQSSADTSVTKEISACLLLVILSSIFVIGSLPMSVAYMFAMYYNTVPGAGDNVRLSYNCSDIGWILFFLQEATNWFVYMWRMKNFRVATMRLFGCTCTSASPDSSSSVRKMDFEVTTVPP